MSALMAKMKSIKKDKQHIEQNSSVDKNNKKNNKNGKNSPTLEAVTPEANEAAATIVYAGGVGRASIELRAFPDGSNEAYLVPSGAAPIPTGVSLIEDRGKYYIQCRKRKKRVLFKPEEVIRQKLLGMLMDDLGYPEDHIQIEVGVQMGSTIHEKPADIVVYTDSSNSQAWLIVETKKPNRKDGVEQLKSYMNPTGRHSAIGRTAWMRNSSAGRFGGCRAMERFRTISMNR